jgi:hypothetical protein
MKAKPLEWTSDKEPNEECRYTHCIAETPFVIILFITMYNVYLTASNETTEVSFVMKDLANLNAATFAAGQQEKMLNAEGWQITESEFEEVQSWLN